MVITTTRITQMHDIVETLQDGPESIKEILWSEGSWLGEEVDCAADSYSVDDRSRCQSCRANSSSPAGSTSINKCWCNAGFHISVATCVPSPAGTFQSEPSPFHCMPCYVGMFSPIGSVSRDSCYYCATGSYLKGLVYTYLDNSWCQQCAENSDSAYASNSIDQCLCNAGWSGTNGACIGCVAGKYKAEHGPGACTNCAPGKFSEFVSAYTDMCVECAAGSHSSDSNTRCLWCPANSRSLTAGSSVDDCLCNAG